jgi:hypothetical protein
VQDSWAAWREEERRRQEEHARDLQERRRILNPVLPPAYWMYADYAQQLASGHASRADTAFFDFRPRSTVAASRMSRVGVLTADVMRGDAGCVAMASATVRSDVIVPPLPSSAAVVRKEPISIYSARHGRSDVIISNETDNSAITSRKVYQDKLQSRNLAASRSRTKPIADGAGHVTSRYQYKRQSPFLPPIDSVSPPWSGTKSSVKLVTAGSASAKNNNKPV